MTVHRAKVTVPSGVSGIAVLVLCLLLSAGCVRLRLVSPGYGGTIKALQTIQVPQIDMWEMEMGEIVTHLNSATAEYVAKNHLTESPVRFALVPHIQAWKYHPEGAESVTTMGEGSDVYGSLYELVQRICIYARVRYRISKGQVTFVPVEARGRAFDDE